MQNCFFLRTLTRGRGSGSDSYGGESSAWKTGQLTRKAWVKSTLTWTRKRWQPVSRQRPPLRVKLEKRPPPPTPHSQSPSLPSQPLSLSYSLLYSLHPSLSLSTPSSSLPISESETPVSLSLLHSVTPTPSFFVTSHRPLLLCENDWVHWA